MQETLNYLQQLNSWIAPGPAVVGFVYALIAIAGWTAFWQAVARDKASASFFARRNSWWTGLILGLAGVGIFLIFAGPSLLEAIKPLVSVTFAIGCLSGLVFLALAIGAFWWARRHRLS